MFSTIYTVTAHNDFDEVVFEKKVCSCTYCDEIIAKLMDTDDAIVITVIDDLTGEVIFDKDKTKSPHRATLADISDEDLALMGEFYEEFDTSLEKILSAAILRSTIR